MRRQSSKFLKFIGPRSSFSKKDALTPLAPSASLPPPLPLRRRQLPLPTDICHAKGQPPERSVATPTGCRAGRGRQPLVGILQPALLASAAVQAVLPVGSSFVHRRCHCGLLPLRVTVAPCGRRWPPLRASPNYSRSPPCRGLGHDRPYMGAGRGYPPLPSLASLRKYSKNT
ncbi:hypothetical protein BHE74_00044310 [Ensete ventricosum]|nr:hypothetical protein BHE74_00044310 [Ensete ventricosum]